MSILCGCGRGAKPTICMGFNSSRKNDVVQMTSHRQTLIICDHSGDHIISHTLFSQYKKKYIQNVIGISTIV